MKERPRNKRILFDIGIAGPLAGLVVAIPVLLLGLSLSSVSVVQAGTFIKRSGVPDVCPNTAQVGQPYSCQEMQEGNSLLYLGLKYITKGELLPTPANYNLPPLPVLDPLLLHRPAPSHRRSGCDDRFDRLGRLGRPAGHLPQPDPGRAARRRPRAVLRVRQARQPGRPVILAATILLGFFWTGWWLWAAIIFFLGRGHADPLDQITPLDPRRKALAVLMLVIFLLVLTPVPLIVF